MIDSAKGNLPVLSGVQTPDAVNSETDGFACDPELFDSNTASMLLSIFDASGHDDYTAAFSAMNQKSTGLAGDREKCSTTGSVKFMITIQEEKELRDLGYSQAQINVLKPQEAGDILKAARKANSTE